MTYFKIGTTLIRASRIIAASTCSDDGLLLDMEGGAEVHLDRDQAALFRAYLSPGAGRVAFQSRAVTGLGTVIEFVGAAAPADAPSSIDVAHLRFS